MPRASALLLAALVLLGTVPRPDARRIGSFALNVTSGPYFPGSTVAISAKNFGGTFSLSVLGQVAIEGATLRIPYRSRGSATVIGAAPRLVARATLRIAAPPGPQRRTIAVASYDDGIALHDARTFARLGYAGIGGAVGDVAVGAHGTIAAPQTDGTQLALVTRAPWHIASVGGVVEGNEVRYDDRSGAYFVSDRDVNGAGMLTRVAADGSVARVRTGITAEGIAIDAARGLVYVGNVNDSTVAVVGARSMRVLRRIAVPPRPFGMALDTRTQRLYVVSNQSRSMEGGGGDVVAIDVGASRHRIVAHSKRFDFPLGVALDARHDRIFVTDEGANLVYVLDARTLRRRHAPLRTCGTPWRPAIDAKAERLYVPCATANRVDVFDLRTMRRVHGAPFATGGFPLGVAISG